MATDMFAKYECTYCLDEIIGIRVKCVECSDFDLCLQCFSAGAEIGPHKNDHSYQFVDPGAVEVFRSKSKWTAREEMELLNGIEQFGFGNWEDISNHIGTRNAEEVREEYMYRYVDGAIGRCTWAQAYEKRGKFRDLGVDLPRQQPQSSTSLRLPVDVTPEEATQLGFMAHRGDFEREYYNEAETLVSPLTLCAADEEEDDLDTALTLLCVDVYMERLRERAFRKKVVNDYKLISKFFADRKDRHSRRQTSQDQEVEEKLKWLCRFQSVENHESLVRGVQRQKELEMRMSELLRYRNAGITKIDELPLYEQLARKNESFLGTVSSEPGERRKKKRRRVPFYHKKLHAPHRQPWIIRRARAAAAAAAAAATGHHGGDH